MGLERNFYPGVEPEEARARFRGDIERFFLAVGVPGRSVAPVQRAGAFRRALRVGYPAYAEFKPPFRAVQVRIRREPQNPPSSRSPSVVAEAFRAQVGPL